ncbi:MAG: ATP-binding protein [Planctomycetota bacterium]
MMESVDTRSTAETARATESGVIPSSLGARLLLGLGAAVILPLLLVGFFGSSELRRSTKRSLIVPLLRSRASETAASIQDWKRRSEDLLEMLIAMPSVRALFSQEEDTGDEFYSWFLRPNRALAPLGDFLLVSVDRKILFQSSENLPIRQPMGRNLPSGPLSDWVTEVLSSGQMRYFAPVPDPLASGTSVSRPHDPARYVVPLLVPLRSDIQEDLGVCACLLPFETVQREIQQTASDLKDRMGLASAEVFLMDVEEDRFLLHTDRERLGTRTGWGPLEGFVEEETGWVRYIKDVKGHSALPWRVGVRVEGKELFRSVEPFSDSFWLVILLVLATTLGMAAFLSLAATRSLRELEVVTESLGSGRLEARAKVEGPREVRKLADALNTMAAQLEADRKRLKLAERDRAWTAMARRVAHEIKNPLQPVKLHAELIQRSAHGEHAGREELERVQSSAGVILRQVEALQRIVADFSMLARAGMPLDDKERFKAGRVMQELKELYAVGELDGVRVEFQEEGSDCLLHGSPLRVQQVILNLIKNAIEASRETGGTLVEVQSRAGDGHWTVEVSDRGPGLPEEIRGRAFEPYYSTKQAGTGLGLVICQRHVEAMGGRLELSPREDGGARATVELPLVREK